jgi:hypothetical protein
MFPEPLDVEDVDFEEADSTICKVAPADTFPEPLYKADPDEQMRRDPERGG